MSTEYTIKVPARPRWDGHPGRKYAETLAGEGIDVPEYVERELDRTVHQAADALHAVIAQAADTLRQLADGDMMGLYTNPGASGPIGSQAEKALAALVRAQAMVDAAVCMGREERS